MYNKNMGTEFPRKGEVKEEHLQTWDDVLNYVATWDSREEQFLFLDCLDRAISDVNSSQRYPSLKEGKEKHAFIDLARALGVFERNLPRSLAESARVPIMQRVVDCVLKCMGLTPHFSARDETWESVEGQRAPVANVYRDITNRMQRLKLQGEQPEPQ